MKEDDKLLDSKDLALDLGRKISVLSETSMDEQLTSMMKRTVRAESMNVADYVTAL